MLKFCPLLASGGEGEIAIQDAHGALKAIMLKVTDEALIIDDAPQGMDETMTHEGPRVE